MIRPLAKKPFPSSFLSVEKDTETILRKLFVESRPYSDILKSLLVVNGNDCLDNMTNPIYAKAIKDANIKWLIDNEYIIDTPNIDIDEFDGETEFENRYKNQGINIKRLILKKDEKTLTKAKEEGKENE